jgi:hypothetical protein
MLQLFAFEQSGWDSTCKTVSISEQILKFRKGKTSFITIDFLSLFEIRYKNFKMCQLRVFIFQFFSISAIQPEHESFS